LRYGVGCGKVRLSFLFRTISMELPPEEKGYDVGTLFVHSIIAKGLDNDYASKLIFNYTISHAVKLYKEKLIHICFI
jgi:hypothetical protein